MNNLSWMHKEDFCQFQTDQNELIILKMTVKFLTT